MMGEMNIVNSLCFSMNYINKSNQLKLLNKSTQPRQANIDILTCVVELMVYRTLFNSTFTGFKPS